MSDYATLTDNLSTAYPETPTLSSYRTAISPLLHRIFSSIGLLATHTNAQIEYLILVLAIKINEHGPQRGFEMSAENLRIAQTPAPLPGVGVNIGLQYAGVDNEWWIVVGGMKVVHADAVASFMLAVEEI